MKIDEKIEKAEKELRELKEQRDIEKKEERKKFVLKGKLIVKEAKYSPFFSLPEEFRRIHISIEHTNIKEAHKVGLCPSAGGMLYYYIEGWIVGIGGGTMILDVPCKATEIEWQSIIGGNVPRKFLRDWMKKMVE